MRLTVLEEHGDYFFEILAEFVEAFALAVRSCETWNVTYIEARIGTPFHHGRECAHLENPFAANAASSIPRQGK